MSLTVSDDLLGKARQGEVADREFLDCVRQSLPYAWGVLDGLADRLRTEGGPYADNQVEPPDETARGQLLRLVASDAMRAAVERHFGVRLAFQNCHRVALFDPSAEDAYDAFVSPRAQLLNQSPELVNC